MKTIVYLLLLASAVEHCLVLPALAVLWFFLRGQDLAVVDRLFGLLEEDPRGVEFDDPGDDPPDVMIDGDGDDDEEEEETFR